MYLQCIPLDISDGPTSATLNDTGPIITVKGSHVAVLCTAECNPPCDVKWTDDQGVDDNGGLLSLPNIQPDQHGIYTCVVENDRTGMEKTAELNITVNCKYWEVPVIL